MVFSHRVDMVFKKSHRKILIFRKVRAFLRFKIENFEFWSSESSSNVFCGLFHVRFLDSDQKNEKFGKFYTKPIVFMLKASLSAEKQRNSLIDRFLTYRSMACHRNSTGSLSTKRRFFGKNLTRKIVTLL